MLGTNKLTASERMDALLKEKGKTEQGLADHLKISKNSVRMWKYKQAVPPKKYIEKIAEFLGVSVSFLLTGVPDLKEDEVSSDIQVLISLYSKLDDLRKSEIIAYMKTLTRNDNSDEITMEMIAGDDV